MKFHLFRAVIIRAVQDRRGDEQLLRVASGPFLAVLHPLPDTERLPRPAVRHRQLRRTRPQQAPTKSRPRLHPPWHIVLRLWGYIDKAPNGKTVKGKLRHRITTKPENITPADYYGRVQIQFCISLSKFVYKKSKKQTLGELKEMSIFLVFHLRCFMNMGPAVLFISSYH